MFSWFRKEAKRGVAELTAEFHYLADELEHLAGEVGATIKEKEQAAEKLAAEIEEHVKEQANANRIAEQVRKVFS